MYIYIYISSHLNIYNTLSILIQHLHATILCEKKVFGMCLSQKYVEVSSYKEHLLKQIAIKFPVLRPFLTQLIFEKLHF